jgi:glutaredoxin
MKKGYGMKHRAFILTLSYALLLSFAQAQSVFRWVDQAGKVHYSDRPPEESVQQVQEKRMTQSMIQTSGDNYSMLIASRKYPATLYSSVDCGNICLNAKELLQKRGIAFTSVDVSSDSSKLIKITGNTKVPVLTLGNDIILRGWEEKRWVAAIDQAGYPKHAVRLPATKPTMPSNSPEALAPISVQNTDPNPIPRTP